MKAEEALRTPTRSIELHRMLTDERTSLPIESQIRFTFSREGMVDRHIDVHFADDDEAAIVVRCYPAAMSVGPTSSNTIHVAPCDLNGGPAEIDALRARIAGLLRELNEARETPGQKRHHVAQAKARRRR